MGALPPIAAPGASRRPGPPGARGAPGALGPLGALARVLVGLAAFAATSLALRAVAAPPGGDVIGAKLRHWERHAGDYDTLLVGSSRTFRWCVPAELERASAEQGLPLRAFNLGVPAAGLLEQRYLLARALDERPGLARVVLEHQWLQPQVDPANAFAPRSVYWHDAETTALAVERALHWERELAGGLAYVERAEGRHGLFAVLARALPEGTRIAAEHGQHFLAERLLLGRGEDVVRGLLALDHGNVTRYGRGAGHVSLEAEARTLGSGGAYDARRARFLAEPERYRAAVEALATRAVSFGDEDWIDPRLARVHDLELLRGIVAETRARGAELVVVVMPGLSADRRAEARLMAELGAPVLRYDLPEEHPELYDPALRWDSGHPTEEGARRFSRLLARDLAALHAPAGGAGPRADAPAAPARSVQ